MHTFSSKAYWSERYSNGGTSGAGSYGRLALYKAAVVDGFLKNNHVQSVLELGCGDGHQLSLLRHIKSYVGVDVSETVVGACRQKFPSKRYEFIQDVQLPSDFSVELVLSLDVIFHLVEDDVFDKYMRSLFLRAEKYVIIYSSNFDAPGAAVHVRHRNITDFVQKYFPEFCLKAYVPNLYPFEENNPDNTSFCDFMIFARDGHSVVLDVP